jgi:ABC-2 type transport system ATP-binding protein
MTILLTTHYLDEAQQLCDRVAIIHLGQIVALDTPTSLLAGLGSEILELRVDGDSDSVLASLRARGIATADAFAIGSTLTIALDERPAADAIAAINSTNVKASGFTTRPPTLDDVYLRLTGTQIADAA